MLAAIAVVAGDICLYVRQELLASRSFADRTVANLILTEFYDTGDVVGAARVLNGLGDAKPAPIAPLERR